MTFRVRELAEAVEGELLGDDSLVVSGAQPLGEASQSDVTFVDREKHFAKFRASSAQVAVVSRSISPLDLPGKTLIRTQEPLLAFITLVRKLHPTPPSTLHGIHATAQISPTAKLADNVIVGPFAVIGERSVIGPDCRIDASVVIGDDCILEQGVRLYPHAVLYDGCKLGKRVTIHAHAVIGADGFGYRLVRGQHVRVPQLGRVELADDVDVGASTTIDRATFGVTRIGQGTKIDNLVMVGHNCTIGRHNLLVAQVGIAGSCSTGDYVVMAGQVGVADHIHIGDRSLLGAKSGVHKDVAPDQRMLGCPATTTKVHVHQQMMLDRVPEIRREVKRILKHLGLIETETPHVSE